MSDESGPAVQGGGIDRLPTRLTLAWGTGALGAAVLMNSVTILILYYLVSVVGLDPGIAGTLVFVSKLADAATDPLMGVISDRARFRSGRRRPFLVTGAFFSAVSFAMLFTIPQFDSESTTIAYVLGSLLLYTVGYTIFNVPYMAMPAEMTDGYHERSSLHSYRVVAISIGSSIAGALAPLLLQVFGEGRDAYRVIAISFAALIFASMVYCYVGTREARFTFSTPTVHTAGALGPLLVGWILQFVGFDRDLPRDAVQQPGVLFGILVGVSLLPAALATLSMVTLAFYRLD